MDELMRLEADLATLQTTLQSQTHHRHDLIAVTNRAKEIVRAHQEATAAARAANHNDTVALKDILESGERLAALQAALHSAVVAAQRSSLTATIRSRNHNSNGKTTNPADSYAADITSRLSGLNDRFQDCLQSSAQNMSTLERSVNSVKSLSGRYKAFGEVSGESRRLVSRHAAKKRRDMLMMKAAVAWFLLVCLVIFLKRIRIVWFILNLLYKLVNYGTRRPSVTPPVVNPEQVVDLEL